MRNAKKHQRTTERQRRVSFDLAHNTVHILPSMKQIKHMIQMREKAEQEKQATNQAILDEHIVDEIEQELRACTCHDGDVPPAAPSASCIKSCLKKVPTKEVGDKTRSNGETSRNKSCKSKKQKNKHRQASNDYSSSNSFTIAAH